MSEREMTPSELEDLTINRVEAGAVRRNVIVCCDCGRVDYLPNSEEFRDCLIEVASCEWCRPAGHEGEREAPGGDGTLGE